MIAGGYTTEKIIEAYPELTKEAIKAAEAYATRMGEGGYARGWTGESLWQRDRSV
jgi:uncharacterized protein (DUF433 family)